ncbi:MAG: type I secretion system permease/ATPase [Pseudomonadota bacterium]
MKNTNYFLRKFDIDAVASPGRGLFKASAGFSAAINVLALAGPLYMLQIYDRVLPSAGGQTLIGLTVLLAICYALMGFLEFLRAALLNRAAMRFEQKFAVGAFDSVMNAQRGGLSGALADLRTIRKFIASPACSAVFDAPWTPVFLVVIFLLHPALGVLTLAGGAVLLALTIQNQQKNAEKAEAAESAARRAERLAAAYSRNVETADAMGMRGALRRRWAREYATALASARKSADGHGRYGSAIKTSRVALQSAVLGLGAFLAINGHVSPGAMIAASIITGRALAPIDQVVAQWPALTAAIDALARLQALLANAEKSEPKKARLPTANGALHVEGLSVAAPRRRESDGADEPLLLIREIGFGVPAGAVLAVLGASASGKSSLARALANAWPAAKGVVRIDGADIAQLTNQQRRERIGYLPQTIELFPGSVAENIARLSQTPDEEAILKAAVEAGAHDMILRLPDGYETDIGPDGIALSGGQRQRLGLARALYGDPAVVILDEPNAHLDAAGDEALLQAIIDRKRRKRTTVIITHRPAALNDADYVLLMNNGEMRVFGPASETLRFVHGRPGRNDGDAGGLSSDLDHAEGVR